MNKYSSFLDKLDLEKIFSENNKLEEIWILYRELFDIYETNGEDLIVFLVGKKYNINI